MRTGKHVHSAAHIRWTLVEHHTEVTVWANMVLIISKESTLPSNTESKRKLHSWADLYITVSKLHDKFLIGMQNRKQNSLSINCHDPSATTVAH